MLNESEWAFLPGRLTSTPPPVTAPNDSYIIAGAILFPIVIILLIGNILMFAAVLDLIISRKKESFACAILLLNLAIADSLIGVASLLSMMSKNDPRQLLGLCLISIGLIAMPTMASCLIMGAIACERYKTVRTPFRDRKRDNEKIIVVIALIWISSALVGFAPFMGWRSDHPFGDDGNCIFLTAVPASYVLFVSFGIYLPILTVTSYLHIAMCQASKKHGRKMAAYENTARRLTPFQTPRLRLTRQRVKTEITEIYSRFNSEVAGDDQCTINQNEVYSVAMHIPVNEDIIAASPTPERRLPDLVESQPPENPSTSGILNTLKPEKWSRTVILILGLFICMWTPFWIVSVIQALCGPACSYETLTSTYLLVLGVLNAAVNPVVYISTDKKLKEHCCRCFFQTADTVIDDDESSVFMSQSDASNETENL